MTWPTPNTKLQLELDRRARHLAMTQGRIRLLAVGEDRFLRIGDISVVLGDDDHLRVVLHNPGRRSGVTVYSKRRGVKGYTDPDLIEQTVLDLRKHMVLDDLADA